MYKKLSAIIQHLEKKSGSNLRRLTKDWSWLMISKFSGAAVALLLASVYARYLTQEEYGTYKYILSIFSIITIFSLQGMGDSSQRSIARGKDAAFWQTLKVRLKFSGLTAISSLFIGGYYLYHGNEILGWIFIGATPFIAILDIVPHYNSLLLGRQLFKQISVNNTGVQLLTSLMIVGAVVMTQNLFWLITAFLFSNIFFGLIGFWRALKKNPLNTVEDPTAFSYGAHISILSLVNVVSSQATPFLLWHFLGPVPLAIYSFALAAVAQFRGIFKLLTSSMAFPKLAKVDVLTLQKTLPKKIAMAHVITIPVAIGLTLIIAPTYNLLFPAYQESIAYAQVMTLMLAFVPMRLYATALTAHAKPHAFHAMSIVNTTSILISLLIFIPLFGIWGVVLANVLSQLITNSVVIYFFKRM